MPEQRQILRTAPLDYGVTVSVAVCGPPFIVAEMVDVVLAATAWLVTVKVAVVAPEVTVTVAGTVAAAVLLLDSVTCLCANVPVAGAFSVTVAVEFAMPPRTVVGFNVMEATCGGLSVRVAMAETLLSVAEMVTVAATATVELVTVKFALVAPAATVTLSGVAVDKLLSDSATETPPAGAGPFRVTVPMAEVPPVTVAGVIVRLAGVSGLIVSVAVRVTPL